KRQKLRGTYTFNPQETNEHASWCQGCDFGTYGRYELSSVNGSIGSYNFSGSNGHILVENDYKPTLGTDTDRLDMYGVSAYSPTGKQVAGRSPVRVGISLHDLDANAFSSTSLPLTQLLSSLRAAHAIGNYARRFQYLVKVPLLIIDDFGLKPLRSPEDEDFHDLIAERYERTATILTSNLDFTEWGEAFAANKMIGAATLDRLRHGAYRVILDGESYRSLKPMPEKSKPPAAKGGKPTQA
ncbi:MAG: ATP-binding protein, partial [Sulfuricella sp.]